MILKLPQIEGKIRELTAIIHAPEDFIPTFGFSNETGLPHIEIQDGHYLLIVSEKGVELLREIFDNADELIFKVVQDISFSMATDLVFQDTYDQNFRDRYLNSQKNIMSKLDLYNTEHVKLKQDTLSTDNNSALNESRKNILLKSNNSKKSMHPPE